MATTNVVPMIPMIPLTPTRLDGQPRRREFPNDPFFVTIPYSMAREHWEGFARNNMREKQDDLFNMGESTQSPLPDHFYASTFFFHPNTCPLFKRYDYTGFLGSGAYGFVLQMQPKDLDKRRRITRFGSDSSASLFGSPSGSPTSAPPIQSFYAMKFQRIQRADLDNTEIPPVVELRLLYHIRRLISHWPVNSLTASGEPAPVNVVRLVDWVPCKFDPTTEVLPLLPTEYQERARQAMRPAGVQNYQILVLEYAPLGTLEDYIGRRTHADDARAFAGSLSLRGMLLQLLATLDVLGDRMRLCWHDAKPANVLVQSLPVDSPITHLYYTHGTRGAMLLPVSHTRQLFFQISDLGLASAELEVLSEDQTRQNKFSVHVDRYAWARVYNQRDDVECLVLGVLGSLLRSIGLFALGPRNAEMMRKRPVLDMDTVRFLRKCVHTRSAEDVPRTQQSYINRKQLWELSQTEQLGHNMDENADYGKDYALVALLFEYLDGSYNPAEEMNELKTAAAGTSVQRLLAIEHTWNLMNQRMLYAIMRCYRIHRAVWIMDRARQDVNCINILLYDDYFKDLRVTGPLDPKITMLPPGQVHHANNFRMPSPYQSAQPAPPGKRKDVPA